MHHLATSNIDLKVFQLLDVTVMELLSLQTILPAASLSGPDEFANFIFQIWCHILYMREQIPSNIETLKHLSGDTANKRAVKWLQQAEDMRLALIECCTSYSRVDIVRITIGHTSSAPREIYTISIGKTSFPLLTLRNNHSMVDETRAASRSGSGCVKAMRIVIRTLCGYWAETDIKPSPLTNSFIVVDGILSSTAQDFAEISKQSVFVLKPHWQQQASGFHETKVKMKLNLHISASSMGDIVDVSTDPDIATSASVNEEDALEHVSVDDNDKNRYREATHVSVSAPESDKQSASQNQAVICLRKGIRGFK